MGKGTHFSAKYITNLKPKENVYSDSEKGGLTIRVFPSGRKTWIFIYTFNNKRTWYTLGHYPTVSLAMAHQKQREAQQLLDKGIDPARKRQEYIKGWTVDRLCDEFLEKYSEVKKRPRSAKEDRLNLARDVRPAWGELKAVDIRRGDVVILLDAVVKRGAPTQANRTLATIRKMFAWALERQVIEFNPASGITKPGKEMVRDRVLSWNEIKTVLQTMDARNDVPDPIKKAFKLILLTGCRPGEVLGFRWDRIADNWLEIPGTETKNKRTHRVYLSELTRSIMGNGETGLVLTRHTDTKQEDIKTYSLSFWLKRCDHFGINTWSPHDLRRTCATRLAELGTQPHIISKILNHAETSVTARVYDWHPYESEITEALESLSKKISSILAEEAEQA